MSEVLPLFPLGSVLYPGLLLPLHIFEERYRVLVRELVELPEGAPRRFGVVCIRSGRETGVSAVNALYEVGCTAELTQVAPLPDGRFDVVTIGGQRFRLRELEHSTPYLSGAVEFLAEEDGSGDQRTAPLISAVVNAFTRYLGMLAATRGASADVPGLPTDALTLSYLVAATMVLDLADKQHLLAVETVTDRLALELHLLRREIGLLAILPAAPAPELARHPTHPN